VSHLPQIAAGRVKNLVSMKSADVLTALGPKVVTVAIAETFTGPCPKPCHCAFASFLGADMGRLIVPRERRQHDWRPEPGALNITGVMLANADT
jgi:hypothetical protein